ncbi:MAG: S8 family serine peptidase [Candidatus Binatia bacterium]
MPALLRAGEAVVELRFSALTPAIAARAEAYGAVIERLSFRYARIVARAPLGALERLASLPGLTVIHPLYGAQASAGSVQSQGVAALRVDAARAQLGVDGSGVRIGVLSDTISALRGGAYSGSGCHRVLTGSSPQATGDLPAEITVLDAGTFVGADEGSAMAELVHDVAPGAAVLFASAFPDEATFAENIAALRGCGADVLVDDILFFAEPMFQPGIIQHAAATAVADGALYFSAAANTGDAGIDQVYRDAAPEDDTADQPTGADLHDFGGGDRFAAVTIPPRCGIRLVLQWNEPYSGTLGTGAATDLDLYAYAAESPDAMILARSTDTQGCAGAGSGRNGDPLEILAFQNFGSTPRTIHAAVDHYCGDETVRFRLIALASRCLPGLEPYAFEAGVFGGPAIYGHAADAAVVAVAAADYREIESGGAFAAPTGRIDVEEFSARGGPVAQYFDAAGRALPAAPEVVFKPDLTGPDGTDTAFFGYDSDGNGFPNFFGTSAAAPHAAAVAALLWEAAPIRVGRSISAALRDSAVDIASPGRDRDSGDGLIDAGAAAAILATRAGDCDASGEVLVHEVVTGVRIALGDLLLAACPAADADGDGRVVINDLVAAVRAALA